MATCLVLGMEQEFPMELISTPFFKDVAWGFQLSQEKSCCPGGKHWGTQ